MTTATEFQAKVDKTSINMDRLDQIVNGDADTMVPVDGGQEVPSFLKLQTEAGVAVAGAATARDEAVTAADRASAAAAIGNRGVRSPFQPAATFAAPGLGSEAVWRSAILGVYLPGVTYDPAKYYSFAEITKAANRIDFTLYGASGPTGGYGQPIRTFTLRVSDGYDPDSMSVQRIDSDIGSIAFVPGLIPVGYSGNMYWASAGLDERVFRKGYDLFAATAGLDLVTSDPDTHLIGGGYLSEYAYRHPNEPAEHVGDATFPNAPGLGQYYNFKVGAAVKRIRTAMFTSAGQTFQGKIQVRRLPALIPGITAEVDPAQGELVQEFTFAAGSYPQDIVLTLDKVAYFRAGTSVVVYMIPDSGFTGNIRIWDTPRAGQPNPNGRTGVIYRSGATGPWAFGSATADYAYWQVPLVLESNLIGRDQVEAMLSGVTAAKPRLVLPSKVHAVVGRELNLYYDALALLPDVGLSSPPQFLFDVQCDIGAPTRRSFRVTPTAAQVGNHPLTVLVYDNEDNVVESASTTLSVVAAANPGSVKRILCIGDSTTDDTGVVTKTLQENLASIGGNVPLFIGTHGQAPYNMEARSGQTFGYFANGGGLRFKFTVSGFPANTPFWPFWFFRGLDDSGYILGYEEQTINGGTTGTVIAVVATSPNGQNIGAGWTGQLKLGNAVFNVTNTEALPAYSILKTNGTGPLSIANYISRFNFGGCDLLSADLGINDCRGPLQSEATHMAKIDAAKAIFTSYFAYNANGKVMICLTKSGASTRNIGDVGTQHDSYRMNIHRLRELIIQHFDNGAFDSRVVVCASGLTIDRYYGYPLLDAVPVAARYTETETIHGDLVHPRDNGYKQVADAMTGTALALLA